MFWSWNIKNGGKKKQKITLKIPIKHECSLIYSAMYRDYKDEVQLMKDEMLKTVILTV